MTPPSVSGPITACRFAFVPSSARSDVLERMKDYGVDALPVLEGDRLEGIVERGPLTQNLVVDLAKGI